MVILKMKVSLKKRLHLVLRLRCKIKIDRSLRERGDKKEAGESSRAFKKG